MVRFARTTPPPRSGAARCLRVSRLWRHHLADRTTASLTMSTILCACAIAFFCAASSCALLDSTISSSSQPAAPGPLTPAALLQRLQQPSAQPSSPPHPARRAHTSRHNAQNTTFQHLHCTALQTSPPMADRTGGVQTMTHLSADYDSTQCFLALTRFSGWHGPSPDAHYGLNRHHVHIFVPLVSTTGSNRVSQHLNPRPVRVRSRLLGVRTRVNRLS